MSVLDALLGGIKRILRNETSLPARSNLRFETQNPDAVTDDADNDATVVNLDELQIALVSGTTAGMLPSIGGQTNVLPWSVDGQSAHWRPLAYLGLAPFDQVPYYYDGKTGHLLMNVGNGRIGSDAPSGSAYVVIGGNIASSFGYNSGVGGVLTLPGAYGAVNATGTLLLRAGTNPGDSAGRGVEIGCASPSSGDAAAPGLYIDVGVGNGTFAGQSGPITIAANGAVRAKIFAGSDSPEGAITAPKGSVFLRTDSADTIYMKASGAGNTGWSPVAATTAIPSLSSATPSNLGTAAAGSSSSASRSDHVHGHGNIGGGAMHAQANATNAGFAPPMGGTADRVLVTTNGSAPSMGQVSNAMLASDVALTTGTWSPGIVGRTTPGTQTYSTNTGYWRKRGNLVYVFGEIVLTENSGGSGDAVITMPFTVASGVAQGLTLSYIGNITLTTGYDFFTLGLDAGSTRCLIFENRSANTRNNLPIGSVLATGRIGFSGWYEAAP